MSIFLDVVTVVVFITVIYHAYKKGLVKALVELVGFIAACVVAFLLSGPIGQWIDSAFIGKLVHGSVSQLAASSGKDNASFLASLVGSLPTSMGKPLAGIGAGLGALGAKALAAVVQAISMPLASVISRGIAFFILLVILLTLVGILGHLSDAVRRIPVVGTLDGLLGAVVGVAEALIVMFFISTLFSLVVSLMALQKTPPITVNTINSTYVYKYVNNINPLTGMLLKK